MSIQTVVKIECRRRSTVEGCSTTVRAFRGTDYSQLRKTTNLASMLNLYKAMRTLAVPKKERNPSLVRQCDESSGRIGCHRVYLSRRVKKARELSLSARQIQSSVPKVLPVHAVVVAQLVPHLAETSEKKALGLRLASSVI